MTDPVCGMSVDPASARGGSHEYKGTTYYFCAPGCRQKFAANPEQYLGKPAPQMVQVLRSSSAPRPEPHEKLPSAAGKWTCPMHPEVVRDGPGDCPICGMALEPMAISAVPEANPELTDMSRRFWAALALTIPVFLLATGGMASGAGLHRLLSPRTGRWFELLLATPVCLWAAWPFHVRAARSVTSGNLNMFTLISLGVIVAYASSLVAVVAPGVFPAAFRDHSGQVGVY
ncbi:MAG TPA: YHS domain-containing protein, partial [Vicinamibacterales bacterium]